MEGLLLFAERNAAVHSGVPDTLFDYESIALSLFCKLDIPAIEP